MVFRGNIITNITGNTFSDQGMLFGTFLMKNIFIKIPTPILDHIFCKISSKNAMIFIGFVCTTILYSCISIKFGSKKHEIFNQIEQKTWLKIGVGNLMKIFFIRNVPNNISWSLKEFSVMSVAIFPWKTIKKHVFSCLLITEGIPIVNACTIVALHQRSGTTFLEEAAP